MTSAEDLYDLYADAMEWLAADGSTLRSWNKLTEAEHAAWGIVHDAMRPSPADRSPGGNLSWDEIEQYRK